MFKFDATATLPTVNVPVLVLVGHLDRMTVPEASAYISQHVPRGQLARLVPGGHMALLEQHERLTQAVAAFATECTQPRDSYDQAGRLPLS
jgi:pimeloyl-ACP methyl ester carboxylesterase